MAKKIEKNNTETAYFSGGCFWGVEYYLQNLEGVLATRVGFMGGSVKNPDYQMVCHDKTGHTETVEVVFDNSKTSFEELAKLFFEIHDPGQLNRQGPDIGEQYRSAIFYTNENQKSVAEKLIAILKEKGHKVVTQIIKADAFWPAEDYHQKYYLKNGGSPHCHFRVKKF